jgi:hypothetical protein
LLREKRIEIALDSLARFPFRPLASGIAERVGNSHSQSAHRDFHPYNLASLPIRGE